jgi:hypothetical protein
MRPELEMDMEEFNALDKAGQIKALCAFHECNEKQRKIHYAQYVNRRWNPHPPQRFVRWWNGDGPLYTEKKTGRAWLGVEPRIAFNCEAVREAYHEVKSLGLI